MSVFVFIINYVVVFPMYCSACLQFYPDEMISWSSLKISDGAWKQFQRIKKIPPSKNSERGNFTFCKPRQPRTYLVFFLRDWTTYLNFLIFLSAYYQSRCAANAGIVSKACHSDFYGSEFRSAKHTAINLVSAIVVFSLFLFDYTFFIRD